VVEHPESKVAKNVERIARKLLAVDLDRVSTAVPKRTEDQSMYEVLEIDPGASDEDIRRAYKRAREMYTSDSMVVSGLFSPERLAVVQARIEEAYESLLDPEKRKQQDLKLYPDGIPARPAPVPNVVSNSKSDRASGAHGVVEARNERSDPTPIKIEVPPEPAIFAETEFTGDLLKQVREARSIELLDISQRTKISVAHLRAIEEERWDAMPAPVYLRGFLVEYARYMRLDVGQVTRTFMARANRARQKAD
jgi:flagellar biosynthesis protein FlhG